MTAAIQPGTVTATSPLLVEVAGDPPGGLPAEQLGQAAIGDVGGVVEGGGRRVWLGPYGPPSTLPPSPHTHTIAQVTGLQSALNGKADTSHSHSIAQVTNLQTTLNGKASTSHTHTIAQVTGLTAELGRVSALEYRSGWVNVPLNTGFTGSIQYLLLGSGVGEIRINVTRTAGNFTTSYETVGVVPSGLWPAHAVRFWGFAATAAASAPAQGNLSTGGAIALRAGATPAASINAQVLIVPGT